MDTEMKESATKTQTETRKPEQPVSENKASVFRGRGAKPRVRGGRVGRGGGMRGGRGMIKGFGPGSGRGRMDGPMNGFGPMRVTGRMRPYPDLRGHRGRGGPMSMGPPPPPPLPMHLRGPFPPMPRHGPPPGHPGFRGRPPLPRGRGMLPPLRLFHPRGPRGGHTVQYSPQAPRPLLSSGVTGNATTSQQVSSASCV